MRSLTHLVRDTRDLVHDLSTRHVECLVVQAHYDPRFALASSRFPTCLILHDPKPHSGEETNLPWRGRALARLVEATASCVLIHSDRLRSQVRPFLEHQKVGVVPHGTELADRSLPVPTSREILLLGRLYPYKGVEIAVDAFNRLRALRPDVRLTIAGRGPVADSIRAVLPEGAELMDGYITDGVVDVLLRRATLMCLPYTDATQSGVGLLAIGFGVPCVVSAEGGLPDLIPTSVHGAVVPSGDPEALARAILAHLDHGQDTRRAFHDHAKARFAWSAAGRDLLRELDRLDVLQSAAAVRQPVD